MKIGIDLGTTNSALAYIDEREAEDRDFPPLHIFETPQLVAAGRVEPRRTLPSFLYLEDGQPVGVYAREQGALVPTRLVHSAKSWLSNPDVDRTAKPFDAMPLIRPDEGPQEQDALVRRHVDRVQVDATPAPDLELDGQKIPRHLSAFVAGRLPARYAGPCGGPITPRDCVPMVHVKGKGRLSPWLLPLLCTSGRRATSPLSAS